MACKGALTIGAGTIVTGNVITGGAFTAAATTTINGYIESLGALSIGANGNVNGNVITPAALTIAAYATLTGEADVGGAATLAAMARVTLTVDAGGAVVQGAGAMIDGGFTGNTGNIPQSVAASVIDEFKDIYDEHLQRLINDEAADSTNVEIDLETALFEGTEESLPPGKYFHRGSWTLAAERTITLVGGATDEWSIRIEGETAIVGTFELSDAAIETELIIWLANGAFAVGAESTFYGIVLSPAAISIAASTKFYGRLSSSGGACVVAASATIEYLPPAAGGR